MKKFLLGLFVGLILAVLTVFVIGFSLVRLGERRPAVADGSTLILTLGGDIPEKPPVEVPLPFVGHAAPLTMRENWGMLKNATTDTRIKGIVFIPERLGIGWAKAEELRQDLLQFKKSGKPLIAYLKNPGTREYYVASAA